MYINESAFYKELIDPNMCAKCGGKCCQTYPCSYYPSDFKEMNLATIRGVISSTDAVIDIERNPLYGSAVDFYYLLLRPRGICDGYYRVLTDFRLMKCGIKTNRCIHLKGNGCELDVNNRPGEGIQLIPQKDGAECYLSETGVIEQKKWYRNISNQQVLYEVLKSYGEQKFLEEIPGEFILKQR